MGGRVRCQEESGYAPRGLSRVRTAAAARVAACAFLTYPLLSDAPSYAGWPTGQLGSALYGAQWAHLRNLLLAAPSTEWEPVSHTNLRAHATGIDPGRCLWVEKRKENDGY